jgi:hypothetical protein
VIDIKYDEKHALWLAAKVVILCSSQVTFKVSFLCDFDCEKELPE